MGPSNRELRGVVVIGAGNVKGLNVVTAFAVALRQGLELAQMRVAVAITTDLRDSAVAHGRTARRLLHMLEPREDPRSRRAQRGVPRMAIGAARMGVFVDQRIDCGVVEGELREGSQSVTLRAFGGNSFCLELCCMGVPVAGLTRLQRVLAEADLLRR